jgi:hypothetical protein
MLVNLALGLGTVQAETIDIVDNHGGRVDLYDQRWAGLAAGKPQVRVTGPCKSACTVLLNHVPRCIPASTSLAHPGDNFRHAPKNGYRPCGQLDTDAGSDIAEVRAEGSDGQHVQLASWQSVPSVYPIVGSLGNVRTGCAGESIVQLAWFD